VRSRFASFLVFFSVISALLALVHRYLYVRLVADAALGPVIEHRSAVAFASLAVALPCGMVAMRLLPRAAAQPVAWLTYAWMGLLTLLLFGLLGSEVVRGGIHLYATITGAPLDASRSLGLSRAIAATVGIAASALAVVGASSALGEVGVRRVDVKLPRFPEKLGRFRVAQLSDVHIGPTLGGAWLARVVEKVNALEADAIVITGDLVDGPLSALREHVAPLADLRAKHGVYFVTGNHEYYAGADEWIAEFRSLGIHVLRNERVSLGDGEHSFDLAGVDDWTAARFGSGHGPNLDKALEGRDASRELVLLAHQPKQIREAAEKGVGLQISGHTHGGQIFPWHALVKLDQPYLAGLSKHGDTQIYVSRGTGYWGPPIRVGAPSEITLLEIARA
jgi:predicted MPP superfamily phosphohydrolase